jgi:hypothetical protein
LQPCYSFWFLDTSISREIRVPIAFEIDEKGRTILTNGIALGPPAPQLQIVGLQEGDVLIWYSSERHRTTTAIQEFSGGTI